MPFQFLYPKSVWIIIRLLANINKNSLKINVVPDRDGPYMAPSIDAKFLMCVSCVNRPGTFYRWNDLESQTSACELKCWIEIKAEFHFNSTSFFITQHDFNSNPIQFFIAHDDFNSNPIQFMPKPTHFDSNSIPMHWNENCPKFISIQFDFNALN